MDNRPQLLLKQHIPIHPFLIAPCCDRHYAEHAPPLHSHTATQ